MDIYEFKRTNIKNKNNSPTPPMTELESNFAFFVAKSWLLLSAAGAMTAV